MKTLFLCTGNSAGSQIAEAPLRLRAGQAAVAVEAASAGTDPQGVNPLTIEVLAELGIDCARPSRSTSTATSTNRGTA